MTTIPASSDSDGVVRLAEVVFPGQLNHHGTYFAGAALGLMSRAALVVACRAAHEDVVMAACERSEFCSPVYAGELVEAVARLERVGRRSMTVSVEMMAETLTTGERRRAAVGRFEMVAVTAASPDNPDNPDTAGAGDGETTALVAGSR